MPELLERFALIPPGPLPYSYDRSAGGIIYPEVSDKAPAVILVVDDDDACRQVLREFLRMAGYAFLGAENASGALGILRREKVDLVVSDIKMGGKDGVALMQEAHRHYPELPFIIMTGCGPEYSYEDIICAGAADFLNKPFSMGELKAKICRIQREQHILRQLQQTLARVKKLFENTVGALATTLEKRDPYTAGHQCRVSELACAIGRELGLPPESIEVLRLAAFVHDIGKVGVPTEILTKPSRLSETEMCLVRAHCQIGYDILKNVEFPWPIAEMVFQHHERINGSGYPRGLKGPQILLEAKILGVADVVEAMSSHRPYRPALELSAALEEISLNQGILYDREVVRACLRLFNEKGFTFTTK
jgi:response regulator RpfG family c-di-GMP phosphodiesterase